MQKKRKTTANIRIRTETLILSVPAITLRSAPSIIHPVTLFDMWPKAAETEKRRRSASIRKIVYTAIKTVENMDRFFIIHLSAKDTNASGNILADFR